MKTFFSLLLVGGLSVSALPLPAAPYEITFFSIDGGGGTSSGGSYTLSGTIGQPDAGAMSGGSFILEGGFWGGAFAVQQVGAPSLQIARDLSGNVIISWVPDGGGFALQFSDDLASPLWGDAPSGGQNPVLLPATLTTRFYRLKRP